MTKIYQGLGLSCMYPENWTLTEDTEEGQTVGFTLESPTSAFMTVTIYPWNVAPSQAIEEARKAMQLEYDDIEFESIEPGIEVQGKSIDDSRAGEVRFYYLDLLIISRLIAFTVQRRTFLMQLQAEDRDFTKLEMVFRAILVSMLKSLE